MPCPATRSVSVGRASPPLPVSTTAFTTEVGSCRELGVKRRSGGRQRSRGAGLLPFPLAVVTFVLTYWCVDITSPALTEIQDDLDLSDTVAGLIFSVFFAGRLVANFPAAFLADRVGARTTAGMGGIILLAGSILAASAPNEYVLLPARALQGAGVSLLVLAALLSTLRARPGDGAAMTIFNVGAGVGGAFGLVSGGLLAENAGWRSVYWLCAGLAAVLTATAVATRTRGAGAPCPGSRVGVSGPAPHPVTVPSPTPRRMLAAALAANLLVYGNYSIFVVGLPLYADERVRGLLGAHRHAASGDEPDPPGRRPPQRAVRAAVGQCAGPDRDLWRSSRPGCSW